MMQHGKGSSRWSGKAMSLYRRGKGLPIEDLIGALREKGIRFAELPDYTSLGDLLDGQGLH